MPRRVDVSIRSRLCSREMHQPDPAGRGGHHVSIRSRLCSREMPSEPASYTWTSSVSIRSRLCSREMRLGQRGAGHPRSVSIRSRLCSREMPSNPSITPPSGWFQSAPGFAAGRCSASATLVRQSKFSACCANPAVWTRTTSAWQPLSTRISRVFKEQSAARTGQKNYRCFRFAHGSHRINSPSKSTARNTPYCFTGRWADSVIR